MKSKEKDLNQDYSELQGKYDILQDESKSAANYQNIELTSAKNRVESLEREIDDKNGVIQQLRARVRDLESDLETAQAKSSKDDVTESSLKNKGK